MVIKPIQREARVVDDVFLNVFLLLMTYIFVRVLFGSLPWDSSEL